MIRLARENEIAKIRYIWEYCFDDTPEFVDFYFSTCFLPDNTLVFENNRQIQSCLQLLPYTIFLRCKKFPVSYIVGVATLPEYRGQGVIRLLLKEAGRILEVRSNYISILLPFQYEFYRKYGWEVCYDLLIYNNIEPPVRHRKSKIISNIEKGRLRRVNISNDLTKLNKCNNKFMKRFHGYILRSSKDWCKVLRDIELDKGFAYMYECDEDTYGYILYTIKDNILTVQELVYMNPETKTALLQLVYSHMGQVSKIRRIAPYWDTEYLLMEDARGRLQKETFVMGRIHNVIGTLTGIPYEGDDFVIHVYDCFYKENNGCYSVRSYNGTAIVEKVQEKPSICLDINTLTQLLWGYLPVEVAYNEGFLTSSSEEALLNLQHMFPMKHNYMSEVY
ncbi:MAG: GNAT family N-acetyltransferase [Clostridiales bacterium]|nr:GNAT family N-acetyltransferase [Clostridiales bacterium]